MLHSISSTKSISLESSPLFTGITASGWSVSLYGFPIFNDQLRSIPSTYISLHFQVPSCFFYIAIVEVNIVTNQKFLIKRKSQYVVGEVLNNAALH